MYKKYAPCQERTRNDIIQMSSLIISLSGDPGKKIHVEAVPVGAGTVFHIVYRA